MLREPRKEQPPPAGARNTAEPTRRFRIVKLEERIAPGKGKGSANTCGGTCHKCGKTA